MYSGAPQPLAAGQEITESTSMRFPFPPFESLVFDPEDLPYIEAIRQGNRDAQIALPPRRIVRVLPFGEMNLTAFTFLYGHPAAVAACRQANLHLASICRAILEIPKKSRADLGQKAAALLLRYNREANTLGFTVGPDHPILLPLYPELHDPIARLAELIQISANVAYTQHQTGYMMACKPPATSLDHPAWLRAYAQNYLRWKSSQSKTK